MPEAGREAARSHVAARNGATAVGGDTARILLVDDRPENLLALEAILHGLGHDLVRASSGEEALKRLLTDDYALILLDVQMPGMDGFETAAHIKRRERTRDIPIVFLTAMDAEAHQAFRGYTAGAVDFITKPFDPWVLRAKVSVFIDLHERRRLLAAQADRLRRTITAWQRGDAPLLAAQARDSISEAERIAGEDAEPALLKALEEARQALTRLEPLLADDSGREWA